MHTVLQLVEIDRRGEKLSHGKAIIEWCDSPWRPSEPKLVPMVGEKEGSVSGRTRAIPFTFEDVVLDVGNNF